MSLLLGSGGRCGRAAAIQRDRYNTCEGSASGVAIVWRTLARANMGAEGAQFSISFRIREREWFHQAAS